MWTTTEIPAFDLEAMAALAAAAVPAVRLARFASIAEAHSLRDMLLARAVRTHSVAEVTRLGISQYEQGVRGSKAAYFRKVQDLTPVFDAIYARSFPAVDRFIARLREIGIDAIAETRVQFAWNVYLDNPGGGGDLQVWERRWSRQHDLVHQVEGQYYYRPDVVDGARRVDVPVTVGDVVIVNSAVYHAVGRAAGRIGFGSFISLFDDNRFRLWS